MSFVAWKDASRESFRGPLLDALMAIFKLQILLFFSDFCGNYSTGEAWFRHFWQMKGWNKELHSYYSGEGGDSKIESWFCRRGSIELDRCYKKHSNLLICALINGDSRPCIVDRQKNSNHSPWFSYMLAMYWCCSKKSFAARHKSTYNCQTDAEQRLHGCKEPGQLRGRSWVLHGAASAGRGCKSTAPPHVPHTVWGRGSFWGWIVWAWHAALAQWRHAEPCTFKGRGFFASWGSRGEEL